MTEDIRTPIVRKKNTSLSLANPSDVMGFGQVLKGFIKENGLSVKIGDSDYSMVDGWKFAGLNFGLTAIPSQPVAVHNDGDYITILYARREFFSKTGKYMKEVAVFAGLTRHKDVMEEIREREKPTREMTKPYFAYQNDCSIVKLSNPKIQISRGTGFCSNLEMLKTGFDEYSVISMTETRSIGKGYRNLLGYVMKAAGMATTPAEEMTQEMGHKEAEQPTTNMPPLTDSQFASTFKKVMAGEWTVEQVKRNVTLNEKQEQALQKAQDDREAKKS